MSESTNGLALLIALSVASSVVWHSLVSTFSAAILSATFTATIAFQVFAYLELGHLDPFFVLAAIMSAIVAFIIAFVVGLPFRAIRKRAVQKH